ncbi:CHAT domain-containing protein [[Flexibacter] sp. ATCC 35208]|uniref:CHAT domain-containing protein n=1 Tax=[Flexibacter] sp. ATCC 35208 TaxID=1936242 RepID=UPI0009CEFA62|nr:CHAT domain-containing protein [[Flexibacter] sp. ATCC 35208]OMP75138.1 hypothetical protein BW716_31745 [[Flexibacter] sp. ATCC 35208]
MAVRVVLAFANDDKRPLDFLRYESETVYQCLKRMDRQFVTANMLREVSANDLRTEFAYDSPLNVFHFSGHAGSLNLLLADGQEVNGNGIAKMLSKVKGLDLVFLNGCATYDLVDAFHKAGAKIVIASSREVFDEDAAEFSVAFYLCLSQLSDVGTAFDEACAWLQTRQKDIKGMERHIATTVPGKETDGRFPFKIFYKPIVNGGGEIDEDKAKYKSYEGWKIRNQVTPSSSYSPYLKIIEVIGSKGNDIADYILDKMPAATSEVADFGDLQNIYNIFIGKPRTINNAEELHEKIVMLVPRPLEKIMGRMFTNALSIKNGNSEVFEDYWEDLLDFYDILVKFTCYIMVSDLFERKYRLGAKFVIDSHIKDQVQQLLELPKDQVENFNYRSLIRAIPKLIRDNGQPTFVEEYMTGNFIIDVDDLNLSHNIIRLEKIRRRHGTGNIQDHCRIVEKELCNILNEVCFILRYNLLVVRNIEAVRFRFDSRQIFRHSILELRQRQLRTGKEWDENNDYSQNYSVILAKGLDSIMNYLSLSPLIIDKCLITNDENSQLYYYSHSEGDKIVYMGGDDKEDTIEIEFQLKKIVDLSTGVKIIIEKTVIPFIEHIDNHDLIDRQTFDKEKAMNRLTLIYEQFDHLRTTIK